MKLPFASDALRFLIPLAITCVVMFGIGFNAAGWVCVFLIIFVAYFFRDPVRIAPAGEDLLVAPADGKVIRIDKAYQSPDHPDGSVCISIFLSIFNVHIQRAPIAGKLIKKLYNKGKFMAAWNHKASQDNEHTLLTFDTDIGVVAVKQIAGFVARRIVCWVAPGHNLDKGERLGLIRFGSRVDLILPAGVEIICKIGDNAKGGETVMARAHL